VETESGDRIMTEQITRRVVFEALDQVHDITGDPHTVNVRMTSTAQHPHKVTLTFKLDTGVITWPISRDLLIDGIVEPAGLGDVQVAPDQIGWVAITLRAPNGTATFRVRRRTLINFLADTASHVDITTELDDWLRGLAA
jgi:hypothetical protein